MSLSSHSINHNVSDRITVLVIDDDDSTRMLLRASISQWGYEIEEACDGLEAWNRLNQPNPPQILLLDWLMPKMDGLTLCKRILEEYKGIRPYLIILSNLSQTSDVLSGLDAGADSFISKPFNISELKSRLTAASRTVHYRFELANKLEALDHKLQKMIETCDQMKALLNEKEPVSADVLRLRIKEMIDHVA